MAKKEKEAKNGLFPVFGEFDSWQEINEAAEGLLQEGDQNGLRTLAAENGLEEEAELYLTGDMTELCDPISAALGKIKRDSRDYQKNKNIITRAIGTMKTVDTDLFALKLKPKDTILMCSDGLSNMVDEFEMEYIIRTEEGIRRKTEILVEAANRSGGRDNISVILIEPQIREVTL